MMQETCIGEPCLSRTDEPFTLRVDTALETALENMQPNQEK